MVIRFAIRGNAGGHISELLLEKLSQKIYGWEVPRWGQPAPLPAQVPLGPLVLLCDEGTSSDGEVLVHRWQKMCLGPVSSTP